MKRRITFAIVMAGTRAASGDPMLPTTGIHTTKRRTTRLNLQSHGQGAGPIYQRRNPNDKPIDYGGEHPYELMDQRRKKKRQLDSSFFHWYDPSFSVDDYIQDDLYDTDDTYNPEFDAELPPIPETEYFNSDKYLPIRIKFDTRHMDEEPGEKDKDEFITYEVMPAAIQFWTKALSVFPAKRLFVSDETCSLGIPEHRLYGFKDADLMLYISADRFCETGTNVDTIAGADSCDWDQYDRPIGGIVDFCYSSFDIGVDAVRSKAETLQMLIEVAIHEIGHVIGLRSNDMAFYYDREKGIPRTPRPINPNDDVVCVTGEMSSQLGGETYKPASSTLKPGANYPGIRYFEVVTPTVRRIAQNHFNCSSMQGLRLENQPTSNDCYGEHWEERLAWDSSMSATLTPRGIPEHLSPFTLALMEDTGWYKANWTLSRNPSFGHGAGCDFVNEPCIVNDTVPSYAKPYFCDTTDKEIVQCDPTHRMMAKCNLYDLSEESGQDYPPVPQKYRYFSNAALGPKRDRETDWCPMFSERFASCQDQPSTFIPYEEESFGDSSRCFFSSKRPICFETYCSTEFNVLLVKLPSQPVVCNYDGQIINITLDGDDAYFECPRFATVCPDLVCPSACGADSSICDWTSTPPKCIPNSITVVPTIVPDNNVSLPTKTSSSTRNVYDAMVSRTILPLVLILFIIIS